MKLLRVSTAFTALLVCLGAAGCSYAEKLNPGEVATNYHKYLNNTVTVYGTVVSGSVMKSSRMGWGGQYELQGEEGGSLTIYTRKYPSVEEGKIATARGKVVLVKGAPGLESGFGPNPGLIAAIVALVLIAGYLIYLLLKKEPEIVQPPIAEVPCRHCSAMMPVSDRFCPACGKDQNAIISEPPTGGGQPVEPNGGTKIDGPSHTVLEEPVAQLLVRSGELKGRTVGVPARGITLGRGSDCGLVFTKDNISKQHLRIELEDGSVVIRDLGSTNGTYVNGQQVQHAVLQSGDEIRLGDSVLQFMAVNPISTAQS